MRKKREIKENLSLQNIIAPMGVEVRRNTINIGESLGKVYGIVKYPGKVPYGWLSKITNIPNTICSINFTPLDGGIFVESLNQNIRTSRGVADTAKDALSQMRANKSVEDSEKMLNQIDGDKEAVGLLSTILLPISKEETQFEKICRRTESAAAVQKCKARTLSALQAEGYKSLTPFYNIDKDVEQNIGRVMPLRTFLGGFPFSNSGYNDGSGYYFARDSTGGLIFMDTWKRGNDRTNSNICIMGVAGVGKSTAVKHIALAEYMMGTKLIFIDPEREYEELCHNLGGDWIDAGGGKNGKINPLQIREAPRDGEEETEKLYRDEGNGMGDMALHMKTLEVFFDLYLPNLSDMQKALLKSAVIELYNNFNIFWDTDISKLSSEAFPIFRDLYQLIFEKAKEYGEQMNNPYFDLGMLLKDIAVGSDSFLWNGSTSIKAKTRCICLDTHALQDASDKIKRTQYFNLLTWCWQQMSADRTERVMLICDEAYLMIDPRVPQSIVFLRNVEKRSRKYEASVVIISHSVVDFLAPEIKMYGQALLDIPCFKLLMGCDGQNLKETKDLYNLTDAEEELLFSKKRGHGLLMIGSKRLHAVFEIPEYKFKYFGKAGGR